MCFDCELEDSLIDLHARDFISAHLDGEILSTGQLESILGSPDFADVMWEVTTKGRIAVENDIL